MGSYACNAAEVKVEFQPIKTGFLVIFHRPDITQDNTKEKSSEKIRRMIGMNPTVSALDLSKQLGVSSRAVEKQIEILKKEGFIKRIGPDKGGHCGFPGSHLRFDNKIQVEVVEGVESVE